MPVPTSGQHHGARRARQPRRRRQRDSRGDRAERDIACQPDGHEEQTAAIAVATGASTLNTPAATATPLPPWNRSQTG